MGLEDYIGSGNKRDVHVTLFEAEIKALDELCARYDCTRSAVVGALLREQAGQPEHKGQKGRT